MFFEIKEELWFSRVLNITEVRILGKEWLEVRI